MSRRISDFISARERILDRIICLFRTIYSISEIHHDQRNLILDIFLTFVGVF